jgi:hypothetical protein
MSAKVYRVCSEQLEIDVIVHKITNNLESDGYRNLEKSSSCTFRQVLCMSPTTLHMASYYIVSYGHRALKKAVILKAIS